MTKEYSRREAIKLILGGIAGIATGLALPKTSNASDQLGTYDCGGSRRSVKEITDKSNPLFIENGAFFNEETGFSCADSLFNHLINVFDGKYPIDTLALNPEDSNFFFDDTCVRIYKTVLDFVKKYGKGNPNEYFDVLEQTVYGNTKRAYRY